VTRAFVGSFSTTRTQRERERCLLNCAIIELIDRM